jgi:hypothetical protein
VIGRRETDGDDLVERSRQELKGGQPAGTGRADVGRRVGMISGRGERRTEQPRLSLA